MLLVAVDGLDDDAAYYSYYKRGNRIGRAWPWPWPAVEEQQDRMGGPRRVISGEVPPLMRRVRVRSLNGWDDASHYPGVDPTRSVCPRATRTQHAPPIRSRQWRFRQPQEASSPFPFPVGRCGAAKPPTDQPTSAPFALPWSLA
ncbi:hypothetical protein PR202_gb28666 [Eleusine coracana subsp. coracana]|uniref:Uncharacterized protein n=1 Tax=Eleusine coracana subsp. coracana TaxID=191504 RepID=A0AAV5FZE0_ELECO|nr:hypothetical protein PR202_gb28666 [Eleusine coracana subsp. coracana]